MHVIICIQEKVKLTEEPLNFKWFSYGNRLQTPKIH